MSGEVLDGGSQVLDLLRLSLVSGDNNDDLLSECGDVLLS